MDKRLQLVKELQMLIGNEEMNDIIDEKMMDMWRWATHEESSKWVERMNRAYARQKEHMSKEEKERMEKTHFFYAGTDDSPECNYCGITNFEMDSWPRYCLTKEEREK